MNFQVKSIGRQKSLYLCMAFFMFSAQAVDNKTLEILQLLKDKKYTVAVPLLEKQVRQVKELKKKGYYSFLLNQLPADVKMKKPRHEYAFIAGQYAPDISQRKKLLLWMEAGDGFFKTGNLKKASYCYQKALSYTHLGGPEKPYILHKQAWIYINQKKWDKAYALLRQAITEKAQKLKVLILFDMGKIWVESQYFKNKIPVSALAKEIKVLSIDEKKSLIQGMAQGVRRVEKQSFEPLVSTLSDDKTLSTAILNDLLSTPLWPVRSACQLIPWVESTNTSSINKKAVFSVLNSCTRYWISKKKNPNRSRQLKRIASLYTQFERKGMERWPLSLSYHHLRWHNKACTESLYQLTELLNQTGLLKGAALGGFSSSKVDKKHKNSKKPSIPSAKEHGSYIETSLKESGRFCKKAKKPDKSLVLKTAQTLLADPYLSAKYKNREGDYESTLFNFFKLKVFSSSLKPFILTAHENWKGKDFLPLLLLPNINSYQKKELKAFMDRFSARPLDLYYLNILIERQDILTEENLNKWIPLADIKSYAQSKPYIQAFLSGHLTKETEKTLSNFLKSSAFEDSLSYKEKEQIALFLALYYLKSRQIGDIFKSWDKIADVFLKKDLAVELFEKSLLDEGKSCKDLQAVIDQKALKKGLEGKISKKTGPPPLLAFIYQCCAIMDSLKDNIMITKNKTSSEPSQRASLGKALPKPLPKIQRVPSVLRSSALARDFMFLRYVQKTTLRLESSISHLEKKTPQMIMRLRKLLSRYQKRQWHLKKLAGISQVLLFRQIDLFEKELSRLAQSSPYGKKYKELRKIVRQWR